MKQIVQRLRVAGLVAILALTIAATSSVSVGAAAPGAPQCNTFGGTYYNLGYCGPVSSGNYYTAVYNGGPYFYGNVGYPYAYAGGAYPYCGPVTGPCNGGFGGYAGYAGYGTYGYGYPYYGPATAPYVVYSR